MGSNLQGEPSVVERRSMRFPDDPVSVRVEETVNVWPAPNTRGFPAVVTVSIFHVDVPVIVDVPVVSNVIVLVPKLKVVLEFVKFPAIVRVVEAFIVPVANEKLPSISKGDVIR